MAPPALWAPTATGNGVALKCANHRCSCATWNCLYVARLLTVSSPTSTPLITTIASVAAAAATIVTRGQAAEAA